MGRETGDEGLRGYVRFRPIAEIKDITREWAKVWNV
jgi:hypothetical protein